MTWCESINLLDGYDIIWIIVCDILCYTLINLFLNSVLISLFDLGKYKIRIIKRTIFIILTLIE